MSFDEFILRMSMKKGIVGSSRTGGEPSQQSQTTSQINVKSKKSDIELKARKAMERLSENMHIIANEPSLALYCLQEHVRKEVPTMIKKRVEFSQQHKILQGACYDCDYSIGAVKSMEKSQENFRSIQDHLKNALFLRQQLKMEESRRANKAKLALK